MRVDSAVESILRRDRLVVLTFLFTVITVSWVYLATYLVAWAGFSLAATTLHWISSEAGLLAPGMVMTGPAQCAVLLIAAGLYQLTPIKQACVRHCRLPAAYLSSHWRPGMRGALVIGLQHGVYCLGCCWFLMLLLFYGGVEPVLDRRPGGIRVAGEDDPGWALAGPRTGCRAGCLGDLAHRILNPAGPGKCPHNIQPHDFNTSSGVSILVCNPNRY